MPSGDRPRSPLHNQESLGIHACSPRTARAAHHAGPTTRTLRHPTHQHWLSPHPAGNQLRESDRQNILLYNVLLDFESVLQLIGNSSPSPPVLLPHTHHLPTRAPQPGHQKTEEIPQHPCQGRAQPLQGTWLGKHSLSIRKHSHYQPGHQWSTPC